MVSVKSTEIYKREILLEENSIRLFCRKKTLQGKNPGKKKKLLELRFHCKNWKFLTSKLAATSFMTPVTILCQTPSGFTGFLPLPKGHTFCHLSNRVYTYNHIHYMTLHYNEIQYNTIQYNTIQYNTIQYICVFH